MSIRINPEKCNGCGKAVEGLCMRVCPGDLITKNENNKAVIKNCGECWDCAACVKECPKQAIEMYNPAEAGGRGSILRAAKKSDGIEWTIVDTDGKEEVVVCKNKSVI